MLDRFGEAYDHVPETFSLPKQRGRLLRRMGEEAELAASQQRPSPLWILKPSTGARGEGIELLADPLQVRPQHAMGPFSPQTPLCVLYGESPPKYTGEPEWISPPE